MVSCSDEDYANDEPDNDWCVRVNWDEERPMNTTVRLRECHGEQKVYCDWGYPGNNEKMIWPYNAATLSERSDRVQNMFNGNRFEAKCITPNQYFKRTQLYPGWKCLIDLDCHSKKCVRGVCIGKGPGETCLKSIDCISGYHCATEETPPVCAAAKKEGESCTQEYDCGPGLFCN